MRSVLISGRHVTEFTPQEYYEYVSAMYELRRKGKAKAASPAPGLTVSRTKKGALSIRRAKSRAFTYVTYPEIAALAKAAGCSQSELWQLFKAKEYIITQTRMEAEHAYGAAKK
jgi:hypothetical protein